MVKERMIQSKSKEENLACLAAKAAKKKNEKL